MTLEFIEFEAPRNDVCSVERRSFEAQVEIFLLLQLIANDPLTWRLFSRWILDGSRG